MKPIATTASVLLLSMLGSSAATIVTAGSLLGVNGVGDEVDEWRSTSRTKTLDPDGDNAYGTAGYVLYATDTIVGSSPGAGAITDPLNYTGAGNIKTLKSIPSYLTLTSNGQNKTAASYGYPQIDDPAQPITSTVSDLEMGQATDYTVTQGNEGTMLNILINSGFPTSGLRIGIFSAGDLDSSTTIRLGQTTGGAATASFTGLSHDNYADLYFFDITDAAVGDVFTLYLTKSYRNALAYGGLTFDVLPVPEPSMLLLSLAGAGAMMLRRNRRD